MTINSVPWAEDYTKLERFENLPAEEQIAKDRISTQNLWTAITRLINLQINARKNQVNKLLIFSSLNTSATLSVWSSQTSFITNKVLFLLFSPWYRKTQFLASWWGGGTRLKEDMVDWQRAVAMYCAFKLQIFQFNEKFKSRFQSWGSQEGPKGEQTAPPPSPARSRPLLTSLPQAADWERGMLNTPLLSLRPCTGDKAVFTAAANDAPPTWASPAYPQIPSAGAGYALYQPTGRQLC